MARPAVILVGADKGGVGKTTVSRTLLDYFASRKITARAFDTECPKGTLKRFHPGITDVVDVTSVSDQMKIFDTVETSGAQVTLIDIRAGLMTPTLEALRNIGFIDMTKRGDLAFAVFHILGPSIASLDGSRRLTRSRKRRNSSLMPAISWSRISSTIRPSSIGTRGLTIPISTRFLTPSRWWSPSSAKWLARRWSLRRCHSPLSSPTRRPAASRPVTLLYSEAMFGIGSMAYSPTSTASGLPTFSSRRIPPNRRVLTPRLRSCRLSAPVLDAGLQPPPCPPALAGAGGVGGWCCA